MEKRQSGFTLIEMLVVIGISGILAAALFGGYRYAVKSARKAKAVEAMANAKDALEMLFQKAGGWPKALFKAQKGEQGFRVMDENVAKVMSKYGLLGVDCSGGVLRGVDRCGIADPWAQAVLKRIDKNRDGASLLNQKVSSAGDTIQEHLIYFAVDEDDDGFVTATEFAPVKKIRAKAIAWCAGEDGGLGDCSSVAPKTASANGRTVTNADNVYSWQRGQEEK